MVGTQAGEVVVPTYNWSAMFAGRLRRLKNIKKYHHIASAPGSVDVRMESDSESEHISLLMDRTWTTSPQQLPSVIPPSGLSLERQWYLYSHIRDYCLQEVRNEVCPHPLTPLSSATASSSMATTSSMAAPSSTAASSSTSASSSTASAASSSHATAQPTSVGSTHHPPPTKRARICSKCHTPGHNARTCGK